MQKFKSSIFSFFTLCTLFLSASVYADMDRMPPKPVDNKVLDSMVGKWKGETEMFGKKSKDVLDIHWGLDHQFLVMELEATGVDDSKVKYHGMGIFGVDAKGKAKTWWFDSWGADAVSTGTGVFGDNKLTLTDGNSKFKEVRTFEIKGDEMVMTAKGTMKWQGKETPFTQSTVYKK